MIVDGWLDWTTRIPGVADKVYSEANSGEWITCHSVVGREQDFEDGVPNRFLSTERGTDGRYTDYAAASCMFVLRLSGELIQMYPVTASTWTSGGREANTRSWAIEAEGGLGPNYGEPLTRAQEDSFIRLVREWERYTFGFASVALVLRQHKDVARQFGYKPTACASDRYANAWHRAVTEEEDSMTPAEEARLARLEALVAGNGYRMPDGSVITGNDALEAAYADGGSLFLGLGNTQADVARHEEMLAALDAKISPHLLAHPGGAPLAPGTKFTVEVL